MKNKEYVAAGPWISVKDALPEEMKDVLIQIGPIVSGHGDTICGVGYVVNGKWYCNGAQRAMALDTVTHWAEVRV